MGICGSGLIDLIAHLIDTQQVDHTGFMKKDYQVAGPNASGTGAPIFITQKDIREVQLAKAAIAAGIKILIKEAKLGFNDIDRLYLAGGFGNYIHADHAFVIGLLPAGLKGKVTAVGNAAGTGTILALNSVHFDEHIKQVLKSAEYIELSFRDDFNIEFAMQMNF